MSQTSSAQEETLLFVLKCFGGQIRGIKRLQKLIFLSQQKGLVREEAKFIFAPYLRGPFSTDCMDALARLSQRGYVQIRKFADCRRHGYHAVQLTEKGLSAAELVRPNDEIKLFLEGHYGVDTDSLTRASYKVFYNSIKPTMLYINTPAIEDVTCYPSSPHWRSTIGERIKLSVPIGRTAALQEKDVEKLERIRDIAAVFTSTKQILCDWKTRKLIPGCIIRTYGVFHAVRQASLGFVGMFSHSASPAEENIVEVVVDGFGKLFFVDEGAETLMTYVVELCGEVEVSMTRPVINALYILGYDVLSKNSAPIRASKDYESCLGPRLGFRLADEDFDASSMFT